jgi:hypothetical protein
MASDDGRIYVARHDTDPELKNTRSAPRDKASYTQVSYTIITKKENPFFLDALQRLLLYSPPSFSFIMDTWLILI